MRRCRWSLEGELGIVKGKERQRVRVVRSFNFSPSTYCDSHFCPILFFFCPKQLPIFVFGPKNESWSLGNCPALLGDAFAHVPQWLRVPASQDLLQGFVIYLRYCYSYLFTKGR